MTAPRAPQAFNGGRWARQCLPREMGNMVDRLTLSALGALHASDEGYVTAQQITDATGLTVELVEDTLADATDRGLVARRRGGFVPVQEIEPEDDEKRQRRECGMETDCASCGAVAGTECRTAAGRIANGLHLPRRQYSDRRWTRHRPVAA